jgi:DNA end-binding protein Ku
MARSAASATMSLGLLTIPIKFYVAASSENFAFNMISPEGNRVKQKLVDEVTNVEVDRDATRRGFEYQKGQYVVFTDADIENLLEEDKRNTVELTEFVPDKAFDPISIEKTYFLAPDKGAERSYRLLHAAMVKLSKMVVGRWYARGKDNLVVIRPTGEYLSLFMMFYPNEVRQFEYQFSDKNIPSEKEVTLATKLIKQLSSDTFDIKDYTDEFAARVRSAIELKTSGKEIMAISPKSNYIGPMDLVTLMENSLKQPSKKPVKLLAKAGKQT